MPERSDAKGENTAANWGGGKEGGGYKEQQEGKCILGADEYSSDCMLRNQKFESLMVYYNYTFICAV